MKWQRTLALLLVFLLVPFSAMAADAAEDIQAQPTSGPITFHDGITWGMTNKQAAAAAKKAKLGKNYSGSKDVLLYKKVPFGPFTATEAYFAFYDDNSLATVFYDFSPVSASDTDALQNQVNQLYEYLCKLYGESENELTNNAASWWTDEATVDLTVETGKKNNKFCRVFYFWFGQ